MTDYKRTGFVREAARRLSRAGVRLAGLGARSHAGSVRQQAFLAG
jgi:hypothetical protein